MTRLALVVLVACSSPPARETTPPPAPIAPPATPPIDAPPPPPVTRFDVAPPRASGPTAKLLERATITLGGVTVSFVEARHKHRADGGAAVGIWSFDVANGAAKQTIELRRSEEGFEAEVAAVGAVLVFRHVSYTEFDVTLASAATALTAEACAEQIQLEAARRGMPAEAEGYSTNDGIVVASSIAWRGHCGTLTRRVWFAPGADAAPR